MKNLNNKEISSMVFGAIIALIIDFLGGNLIFSLTHGGRGQFLDYLFFSVLSFGAGLILMHILNDRSRTMNAQNLDVSPRIGEYDRSPVIVQSPEFVPSLPGYLDTKHAHYSFTLAASIKAWLAFEDETQLKGLAPSSVNCTLSWISLVGWMLVWFGMGRSGLLSAWDVDL
jgi:hypothetical protein